MKRLIIILCFFIIGGSLFAQNLPIDFGPKIGFNTTKLTTNLRDYTHELKKGWQGGVFLRLGNKLYIQPEVYIAVNNTGITYDYTLFDPANPTGLDPVIQNFKLTTVDIPLLLGYKIIDLQFANIRVFGGPVASFILNKDLSLRVSGNDLSNRISSDDFKDALWNFKIGAGVDLLILTLDVSYQWGIDKFYSINDIPGMLGRSNIFYVTVGWKIF
ncbi:porin family protein [Bacteroidota bacterium]